MKITETRDFDIRVGFNECEYKAIDHAVNVFGFSNRAGFIRFHINQALISAEASLDALERIHSRAARGPLRAGREHCVPSHVEQAPLVKRGRS